MKKATLDDTLLTLQRAVDWICLTHSSPLSAADVVAVAILEQAARDVLGVKEAV